MKPERDILVVDDEDVITQAVVRVCGAEGMSVDVAESAAAATERLKKSAYRLIICDVMMADVDGFEFLSELARTGVRTPVIMSTGMSTVENAVKALYSGAIDFIPKPFTADELLTAVHRGFAYARLQESAMAVTAGGSAESFVYVPCPAEVLPAWLRELGQRRRVRNGARRRQRLVPEDDRHGGGRRARIG